MTVYNLLTKGKISFTNQQLKQIGTNISMSAKARNIPVTKVEQKEGEDLFMVYDYPESFKERMEVIIIRYLKKHRS